MVHGVHGVLTLAVRAGLLPVPVTVEHVPDVVASIVALLVTKTFDDALRGTAAKWFVGGTESIRRDSRIGTLNARGPRVLGIGTLPQLRHRSCAMTQTRNDGGYRRVMRAW
jgi:hypothetical protein